jgi:CMP-N-acetylneuraminic acid synthetase
VNEEPKIAVAILARAGSRRVPQKNIRLYQGKPLIEWTLLLAWKLGYPVWVFTDFPRVAEIAGKYHANVRPKLFEQTDGHHETGKELIEYNKEMGADHIILLQPTSPKREIGLVRDWIARYLAGGYDVGFSAERLPAAFYYDIGGGPINFFEKYRDYDGTGKTHIWRETGSFYIFRASQAEKNHFITGTNRILFPDPFPNNDFDYDEDFRE